MQHKTISEKTWSALPRMSSKKLVELINLGRSGFASGGWKDKRRAAEVRSALERLEAELLRRQG